METNADFGDILTFSGVLVTNAWQNWTSVWPSGSRAMNENWQAAGSQVAYDIRLRAWAMNTVWKETKREMKYTECTGRKEMFYLMMHSTHFIYGYMASDIWLRTILIARKETRCRHIGYSYRLTHNMNIYKCKIIVTVYRKSTYTYNNNTLKHYNNTPVNLLTAPSLLHTLTPVNEISKVTRFFFWEFWKKELRWQWNKK